LTWGLLLYDGEDVGRILLMMTQVSGGQVASYFSQWALVLMGCG
jgi:hypothetical protein